MNLTPKKTSSDDARHVIDEYKHKARTVTCVCGWHGGSEAAPGGRSEWTEHLLAKRGPQR